MTDGANIPFLLEQQVGRGTTSQALERSHCTNPSFLLLRILAQRTSKVFAYKCYVYCITDNQGTQVPYGLKPWMITLKGLFTNFFSTVQISYFG